MQAFYRHVDVTRQAHHQWRVSNAAKQEMMSSMKKDIAEYRSSIDFRAGSRSCFYNLDIKRRYGVGVNKFESLVAEMGMTLPVVKVRVITTKSSALSWGYSNLISGLTITEVNTVMVGDITYLYQYGVRYYFFQFIDVFSGRVVGWVLADNMKTERAIEALRKVVKCRGKEQLKGLIQHTDGGGQYFSHRYIAKAEKLGIEMSRAKNCLENGHAEQFNSHLKHHIMPLVKSRSLIGMKRELKVLIDAYNNRAQEGLGWLSPIEFEKRISSGQLTVSLKLYDWG
jgi:putative transposase